MIYEARTVVLRDGREAVFRSPTEDDAERLSDYIKVCCTETDFLLRYPEECNMTIEQEIEFIKSNNEAPRGIMINCIIDGIIAGNCDLRGSSLIKYRHKGEIGIAIREKYWGLGIATEMFRILIEKAKELGMTQLELEYLEGNERGRKLYERLGFKHVGTKPRSVLTKDGEYLDEHMMQLVLL